MARATKKEAESTQNTPKAAAKTRAATKSTSAKSTTAKKATSKKPKTTSTSDSGETIKRAKDETRTMSPRTRRTPVRSQAVSKVTGASKARQAMPALDQVAERAYYLFLERGADHGRDVDDWLEAERQLTGTHA